MLSYLNYGNFVANAGSVGSSSNRWFNMQAPLTDSTYTQKYVVNSAVNLFPLAAYQKIYQDFFRWSQWENADPTSYNFDWYAGSGNIFGSGGIPSSIPTLLLIGNGIIFSLCVIVIGIRISLWVYYRILNTVM